MNLPTERKTLCVAALAAAIITAAPASLSSQSALSMEPVRDGLHVISGAGGNVAVRVTAEGVLLVDSGLPGLFAAIERHVASVTREPIRYVVNTHLHPDHTGGNASLPADVESIGHTVTRDLMERRGMLAPRAPYTQQS